LVKHILLAIAAHPEDHRARAGRRLSELEPIDQERHLGDLVDHERLLTVFQEAEVGEIAAQREREARIKMRLLEMSRNYAGENIRDSYLGRLGRFCEPIFRPLGWDWRIGMSVMASFPAREVIIATMGTIYNLGTDVDEESSGLVDKMRQVTWESGPRRGKRVFSTAVALSIMVFFALSCQCGATLVVVRQEAGSWYYSIGVFVYMTGLAYVSSLVVYQAMNLWTG